MTEESLTTQRNFEDVVARMPELLIRDLDDALCVCNSIPKRTVIEGILAGADTLEKVQVTTYASDGSGCCKRQVIRLIEAIEEL